MTTTLETLQEARPDLELSPRLLDGCEDSAGRYKVVPSVVCSMCCLFGVIYCFFGYRCFKAVMFLTGLMFGSVVIFMLCYKERVLDTQLSVEASVGIGLGIGTLCGLVTMLVRSVGLFMVGLLLGLLVAVATLVGMEELSDSPPRSVWVPLGVLLGLGMLFAVLTLQWQRIFTTLSTAVFGAAVITVALDYFVELFALVLYMYERMKAVPGKPVCWITWVVLGVWPALTLLGVVVQWKVTAEGYSHTKVIISRQQRRMQVMRIRQRDDRYRHKKKKKKHQGSSSSQHQAKQLHQEPAYRRKPNPIRRYDTDVLSPSYIQSFRDRQVQAQPFPGQFLGGPHAAVDLGYDCGSTAPLTSAAGPSLRT
ncbi:transmembrane protein 198-B-like [Dunckerocampus dactyliophorus]|uniref:transmembrane protein 198-B-like n=1 Tax=Dunckerocampus dactyliophorus TaxID=161453 RepID=UPI002406E528|nr:transmembrane protein 198-B-like [Dunckerocampus dactyliophorus]XP_054639435.1 transmembrane protein 198-B-like [Dunckerocampus dactyliophorus]XP_054639446.1 transmembrane protein 198-B-like [Dunckerocampus dactyliophorus]XP_054639455.1 transmembrane protein 198-B-like [Dunckerocampus dactyliophorus]XP_054639464.1 transmembrane protein 198-B-like [Dunckerocampus dactyliophorus]